MKNNNENRAARIEEMLQQLPQMTEETLGGLNAGPHLRARIQLAASEPRKARPSLSSLMLRWAPVACCAALALCIGLGTLRLMGNPGQDNQPNQLTQSNSLGSPTDAPAFLTADLNDSFVITPGSNNPGYRSIWADDTNGNFPLIGVNGRYYRMLTWPRSVSSDLIGSSLGTVAEFTMEPSLSGTNTILSNTASFGTEVYSIRGMDGTLVTADVGGRMRLFQRVSFNGSARVGREKLADTLQVEGRVVAMELSSIGVITDPAVCAELLDILLDCATYKSSGSVSSKQALLIELDNGLVLQMAVKNSNLAACGVWSCPEFFEAFEDACID